MVRRLVSGLIALAATTIMSVGGASAASATTWILEPCQIGSFTAVVGDQIRFTYGPEDGCGGGVGGAVRLDRFELGAYLCEIWLMTETADFNIGGGGADFRITPAETSNLASAIPGNAAACGWGSGDEDKGPLVIPQAVPLPASGSCEVVDDAGLDYGTGLTGGWTASWQEWANGGQGGAVCTRSLILDADGWHVGA